MLSNRSVSSDRDWGFAACPTMLNRNSRVTTRANTVALGSSASPPRGTWSGFPTMFVPEKEHDQVDCWRKSRLNYKSRSNKRKRFCQWRCNIFCYFKEAALPWTVIVWLVLLPQNEKRFTELCLSMTRMHVFWLTLKCIIEKIEIYIAKITIYIVLFTTRLFLSQFLVFNVDITITISFSQLI